MSSSVKTSWTILDALLVFGWYFGGTYLLVWLGRDWFISLDKNGAFVLLFILQQICLLVPMYLFWRRRGGTWEELGFRSISVRKTVFLALSAYGLYWLVVLIIELLSWYGLHFFGMEEPVSPTQYFVPNMTGWFLAYLLFGIIAPLVEEVYFRGFLLGAMARWGSRYASIVVALIFALAHGEIGSLMPLIILGLILSYLYFRAERNIWPCLLFHVLNNVVALLILVI